MGQPLHHAAGELEDPGRWPHSFRLVPRGVGRLIEIGYSGPPRLKGDVVAWLRTNVRRGGWRFVSRGFVWTQEATCLEVILERPEDVVAFKMRWG